MPLTDGKTRELVRDYYRQAARAAQGIQEETGLQGPILGCGSPLDRAQLLPGEDVLDLGCGAGREVIEAALRVTPGGIAYGLDMTDEMLAIALENRRRAGVNNAVFLRGTIENIPLPNSSVDVIISNCVINLSADKPRVMKEMYRVLRPGGRLAISDTVTDRDVPAEAKEDARMWCACLSGALQPEEYRRLLEQAGFVDVRVEVTGWDDGIESGRGFRVGSALVSGRRPEETRSAERVGPPLQADRGDLVQIRNLLDSAGLPTEGVTEVSVDNFVTMRNGEGSIVGVAGVEFYGRQALLRSVCVRPDYRGRGLGGRLVAAVLRRARARGCTEVVLLTTTAEKYFEKKGFRRVQRSEITGPVTSSVEFQRACPETAIAMKMDLRTCCC